MVVHTINGRTTQSLFDNLINYINGGNLPYNPSFNTITNWQKRNTSRIAWNILNVLSGNNTTALINHMLKPEQKLQINPLKQVNYNNI